MSNIELIILGYLKHGEKSAYEMVKEFETWNMNTWIKISSPSIYKNLIKLNENGYLDSKTVKEGEMPEKTIYSINGKGSEYFLQLMENYSSNISNVYFDFSPFLININLLDEKTRDSMIKKFSEELAKMKDLMDMTIKVRDDVPKDGLILMDLYQRMYNLLHEWSKEILNNY